MRLHPAIKAVVLAGTRYGTITLSARVLESMSADHQNHAQAKRAFELADQVLEVFPGARLLGVRAP